MLQSSTIKFLKDLKKNNNKPWFDAHRNQYEEARNDFAGFIQSVIDKHGNNDPSIKTLVAKDCMFRINRDIRFSKDKTPYKSNFGASINKGGKKSMLAGYYFHLEPGRSFAGGGVWMPMPDDLKKLRQEIDYNLADFKKIITSKKFKSVYGELDRSAEYVLSRVPKGYEPNNPAAEYLKLKSYITMISMKDVDLTSKNLVKNTVTAFEALKPLIIFLNHAIEG
ncbi:MAG TPA: DUF2461 domain-containing protein [Chitinophagaceae bacterium]